MAKKIAILYCLRTNSLCTGAACIKAFKNRKYAFSCYQNEDVELVAFCSCSGCGELKFKRSDSMKKKLEQIKSIGADVVHISSCASVKDSNGKFCPEIEDAMKVLESMQIEIVLGTH